MSRFLLAAAWAFTVAIAFSLGRFAVGVQSLNAARPAAAVAPLPALPDRQPALETAASAPGAAAAIASRLPTVSAVAAPVLTSTVKTVTPLPFSVQLETMLSELHPVRRAAAFSNLLTNLTPENAAAILLRLQEQPRTPGTDQDLRLLAFAWGEIDGPGALAALQASDDSRRWRGDGGPVAEALAGWAASNPADAEAWARAKFAGQDNPYMIGVIRGTAFNDPELASRQIYSLPFGEIRGQAARVLVDAYLRDGVESAKQRIANLPPDRLKDGIVRMTVDTIAGTDPQAAADWVMSLSDTNIQSSVGTIAAHWSSENPDQALTWVQSIADDTARQSALPVVLQHWPLDRSGELETLYQATTAPADRDLVARSLAFRSALQENTDATKWLDAIIDPELRQKTTKDIERFKSHRDNGNGIQ